MATLESLRLSGWKSIKETDPPITFGRLNVLVGANGAGKSNLVSFFEMLSQMMIGDLQIYVAKCGGTNNLFHFGVKHTREISFELVFQRDSSSISYRVEMAPAAKSDRFVIAVEKLGFISYGTYYPHWNSDGGSESQLPIVANSVGSVNFHAIESLLTHAQPYHFDDTTETAAVRHQPAYIDDNRKLRHNASNLAAMLYLYKQTRPAVYRRILGVVKQVAPVIEDFVLEPRLLNLKEIQLDWRSKKSDYLLGTHQLSDGTLRMIALVTLLLQPEETLPYILVLDEPELGLHPAAIGILAGLLKQASQHVQVLVATQSVTLVDHFEAEDVIVVDCKDGVSSFHRLDPEPYREWVAEFGLGDLWERNVIGGGPYR